MARTMAAGPGQGEALQHEGELAVVIGLVLLFQRRWRAVFAGGATALGFGILGAWLSWPATEAYIALSPQLMETLRSE